MVNSEPLQLRRQGFSFWEYLTPQQAATLAQLHPTSFREAKVKSRNLTPTEKNLTPTEKNLTPTLRVDPSLLGKG